jgi:protein-L-isoaspartate(D-aspartate) O-methyltransferase
MKILTCLLLLIAIVASAEDAGYTAARAAMVEELRLYAQFVDDSDESRVSDAVMASLNKVKRHELVPLTERRFAYENRPLPIGYGQTISQPYIVALMTELIEPDSDDVVLEVGTGSGYQAAILAELVDHVYSIEIIDALASRAKSDLTAITAGKSTDHLTPSLSRLRPATCRRL